MDFRFVAKERHLDIFSIGFSQEIGSQTIQTSLFLGKYAPRPSRPAYFSRNTRPRQGDQTISREIRLSNPKNTGKKMFLLSDFEPDDGGILLVALKTARVPSAKLFGEKVSVFSKVS